MQQLIIPGPLLPEKIQKHENNATILKIDYICDIKIFKNTLWHLKTMQ